MCLSSIKGRHRQKGAEVDSDAGSLLQIWAIAPRRKAIGSVFRFALTLAAFLMYPRSLHAISPAAGHPFLGARVFVGCAIAVYELLDGQFVRFGALDALTNPIAKTVLKTAASAVAL